MREFLWVEKFAPDTVQDCILPPRIKKTMLSVVNTGNMQNMIFSSSPGTGKTTCAVAACKQIDAEYIVINGSDEGRLLDTARDRVKKHASMVSMTNPDAPKVVIYDEFDNTTQDVQKLLRGLINDFQDTCRFIFTCNSLAKVIDPIQSRCTLVDFSVTDPAEKAQMGMDFSKRCVEILKKEGVPVEDFKIIAQYVMKMFPDFRKILNELQRYALAHGEINNGILTMTDNKFESLLDAIMRKSYKDCRKWLVDNNIGPEFYSNFATYMVRVLQPELIPAFTLIINKYQFQDSMVFDRELNASACMLELIGTYNMGGKPVGQKPGPTKPSTTSEDPF